MTFRSSADTITNLSAELDKLLNVYLTTTTTTTHPRHLSPNCNLNNNNDNNHHNNNKDEDDAAVSRKPTPFSLSPFYRDTALAFTLQHAALLGLLQNVNLLLEECCDVQRVPISSPASTGSDPVEAENLWKRLQEMKERLTSALQRVQKDQEVFLRAWNPLSPPRTHEDEKEREQIGKERQARAVELLLSTSLDTAMLYHLLCHPQEEEKQEENGKEKEHAAAAASTPSPEETLDHRCTDCRKVFQDAAFLEAHREGCHGGASSAIPPLWESQSALCFRLPYPSEQSPSPDREQRISQVMATAHSVNELLVQLLAMDFFQDAPSASASVVAREVTNAGSVPSYQASLVLKHIPQERLHRTELLQAASTSCPLCGERLARLEPHLSTTHAVLPLLRLSVDDRMFPSPEEAVRTVTLEALIEYYPTEYHRFVSKGAQEKVTVSPPSTAAASTTGTTVVPAALPASLSACLEGGSFLQSCATVLAQLTGEDASRTVLQWQGRREGEGYRVRVEYGKHSGAATEDSLPLALYHALLQLPVPDLETNLSPLWEAFLHTPLPSNLNQPKELALLLFQQFFGSPLQLDTVQEPPKPGVQSQWVCRAMCGSGEKDSWVCLAEVTRPKKGDAENHAIHKAGSHHFDFYLCAGVRRLEEEELQGETVSKKRTETIKRLLSFMRDLQNPLGG